MELEERAGVRVRSDLILDTLNIYNEDCISIMCGVIQFDDTNTYGITEGCRLGMRQN